MWPNFWWLQIGHHRRERFTFASVFSVLYIVVLSVILDYLTVSSLPDWLGSYLRRGWALELIRLSTLLHYVFLLKAHISNASVISLPTFPLSSFFLCVVLQMRLSTLWGKAPLGGWWSASTTAGVCPFNIDKQQLSACRKHLRETSRTKCVCVGPLKG